METAMKLLVVLPAAVALPLGFVAHRIAVASPELESAPAAVASLEAPFPVWINGTDCSTEPNYQIFRYDRDTYVIRQSKCVNFEAPFLYLMFGEERALLLDTGASATSDVWGVVNGVIQGWLAQTGTASIPLVVAHSHAHGDHTKGDPQFIGKPGVTVVGTSPAAVQQFFGFQNWPLDIPTFDLGNRVLDVMAIPGHEPSHIALYDHRTDLLLTGDTIYPGHLFVFQASNWPVYVASLRRLSAFGHAHPVKWVLGCHIEMSNTPFGLFPYGATAHPNEHPLQLPPTVLDDVYRGAAAMGTALQCKVFADFALHLTFICGNSWNG